MQKIITQIDFPVEQRWLIKVPISFFFITILLIIFLSIFLIPLALMDNDGWLAFVMSTGMIIFIMIGVSIISLIVAALSRDNFHYSLENEFIVFKQGILTKQQKNLPYSVIQNLLITEDLADRFLKTTSLTIENASFGGGQVYVKGRAPVAWIGFAGNSATIPGLTYDNASKLKRVLLEKIKEYSDVDKKSGL